MVVTTGFFDGVHLGHRLVINRLVYEARRRGEQSVVITFWPHPRTVLQNEAGKLRLLTSLEEKRSLLYSMGVDRVEVIDFTKEFSRLTAEQYLKEYVIGRFGGTAILLGYDHRMGCDATGPDQIERTAEALGLDVIRTPRTGTLLSSTLVRNAIGAGEVKTASEMLGRLYGLRGVVVEGRHIGRSIGFPTANMKLYDPLKLVPSNGVYAVEVDVLGKTFQGMCNIGVRPTVSGAGIPTIETNIFDFDEQIYGLDMNVRFVDKIREEAKFPSLEALASQLSEDKIAAKKMLNLVLFHNN